MAWRCHVSISRSLGHQEAHQEPPYPPSPGWILGGQVVPDALSRVVVVVVEVMTEHLEDRSLTIYNQS